MGQISIMKHNNRDHSQYNKIRVNLRDKVFIHAGPPSRPDRICLCEARVIRVDRQYSNKYKVVITGVYRLYQKYEDSGNQDQFKRLLGMKVLRREDAIYTSLPQHYRDIPDNAWHRLSKLEADKLTDLTINNIKRDTFLKRKSGRIPRV